MTFDSSIWGWAVLGLCGSAYVQTQPQPRATGAYRIDGSIVLYHSAPKNQFNTGSSSRSVEPRWSMLLVAPLFLRTLLRLVFVCPHRHKGPPITPREPIPSNLPEFRSVHGGGTYITCMDCGQKFAYSHKTRRLVDFWGVHDAESLAEVRRRIEEFFSPLRGLAARVGTLKMRIPMSELVKSARRLGVLAEGQWTKFRRLIASKWASRSALKQMKIRP